MSIAKKNRASLCFTYEPLPGGHPKSEENSLEPHVERARTLLQKLIKEKKPADYTRYLSALILLAEEAVRRGYGVESLAQRLPGQNGRECLNPATLKRYFVTQRPRASIVPLARVLRYSTLIARALCEELTRDDVLSAFQRLNAMLADRRSLFPEKSRVEAEMRAALERMPLQERRALLARYLLADDGLLSRDPFGVLGEGLQPYGFCIEEYYAENVFERQRKGRVVVKMLVEALALSHQQRKSLEHILASSFEGYPPHGRGEHECAVIVCMQALLQAEYDRGISDAVEWVNVKFEEGMEQHKAAKLGSFGISACAVIAPAPKGAVRAEGSVPASAVRNPNRPSLHTCDRDGARHADSAHPETGERVEGHPIGCGQHMPEGTYAGSWLEVVDPDDESGLVYRREGRFVPGGWTCERCGTVYYSDKDARMKAIAEVALTQSEDVPPLEKHAAKLVKKRKGA